MKYIWHNLDKAEYWLFRQSLKMLLKQNKCLFMMRIQGHVFKLQSINQVEFLFSTHFIRLMPGLQYCKNNFEKGSM